MWLFEQVEGRHPGKGRLARFLVPAPPLSMSGPRQRGGAGAWPCKLSNVEEDGVEMMRKGLSVATPSGLVEPSPTCVTIPADEWGSKARKISPPKSAAAAYSPSSTGFTRYGGGVFATMRGSHNTYQTTVSPAPAPRAVPRACSPPTFQIYCLPCGGGPSSWNTCLPCIAPAPSRPSL